LGRDSRPDSGADGFLRPGRWWYRGGDGDPAGEKIMRDASERPIAPVPGAAALARGDYAAAIRECDESLLNNHECADVYCNRAQARGALGNLAGAVVDATAAIRLNPHHAWAYRTLGGIHIVQGRLKAALVSCDEAIRIDPFLAEAYNTRAGARLLLGESHAALVDCNQAIQLGPQLWGAYITRGNVRYHLHDQSAADDYQTSFEINPAGYVRNMVRLIADQLRREADSVFANCAEHLRANPQDTTSYARRGMALLLLGKDDEAQEDFDRVVLLRPSSRERLTQLITEAKRVRARRLPVNSDRAVS